MRLFLYAAIVFLGTAFTTSQPVNVPIQIVTPGTAVPAVSFSPPSVNVSNTAQAGTQLATVSVTMSDGSPFTGSITASGNIVSVSGMNLILARDLTPSDVGISMSTITASQ